MSFSIIIIVLLSNLYHKLAIFHYHFLPQATHLFGEEEWIKTRAVHNEVTLVTSNLEKAKVDGWAILETAGIAQCLEHCVHQSCYFLDVLLVFQQVI